MRTYPNMLVLIVAAALMFTSCIGDLSVRVAIRNATDAPVILYELGRERPQFRVRLAPGDTTNTGFMYRRKEGAQILVTTKACAISSSVTGRISPA